MGTQITTSAPSRVAPLHPDSTGFTLFRCLPSGLGRAYSAVEFDYGWTGANRFLRRIAFLGLIRNSSGEKSAGVLDVLNANGDIVQDYDVVTPQGFQYIKRKLRLTVESEDGSATVKS